MLRRTPCGCCLAGAGETVRQIPAGLSQAVTPSRGRAHSGVEELHSVKSLPRAVFPGETARLTVRQATTRRHYNKVCQKSPDCIWHTTTLYITASYTISAICQRSFVTICYRWSILPRQVVGMDRRSFSCRVSHSLELFHASIENFFIILRSLGREILRILAVLLLFPLFSANTFSTTSFSIISSGIPTPPSSRTMFPSPP